MNDKISKKDLLDWKNFLTKKEKLPNKDFQTFNSKKVKIKSFDLHGYSLSEANKKVENLIEDSYKLGVKKLIIVTGKGLHSKNESDPYISKDLGILRYSVPEFINNNKNLMKKISEIKEAEIKDGGSGAFYIYLKK